MSIAAADPALRRFERDAVLACLIVACLSFVVVAVARGFGPAASVAGGVLGGGALMAFSYRAIKGAADVLSELAVGQSKAEALLRPVTQGSGERSEQAPDGAAGDRRSEQGGDASAEDQRSEQGGDASAEDQRSQQDFSPAPVLPPGRRAFLAVKFFTRYALLAVAAYVMLTCFRLHPVGVLAGATSPFLAALMQVARMSGSRRTHP